MDSSTGFNFWPVTILTFSTLLSACSKMNRFHFSVCERRLNSDVVFGIVSASVAKKDSSKSKLDAIETYVRQNQFCRTTQISAYFGESIEIPCGICDICIQEKRENSGKSYPEGNVQERKLILQYLKNGPMNLSDLVDCLRPLSKSEAIKVIQYSLERGEVFYADTETVALASS